MVGWLVVAGAGVGGAVVMVLLLLFLFVMIARIIAEVGLLHGQLQVPIYKPFGLLSAYGWKMPVSTETYYHAALMQSTHYDYREVSSVYGLHALRMADDEVVPERAPQQGRRFIACLGLALLVGYFDDAGELRLAGKVGTGFNETWLKRLSKLIDERAVKECPFVDLPKRGTGRWNQGISRAEMARCTWCKPELVCQVKFTEWTNDGSLRHPVFLGLREDKAAREVRREVA